jgi:hypothetical protein
MQTFTGQHDKSPIGLNRRGVPVLLYVLLILTVRKCYGVSSDVSQLLWLPGKAF